MRTKKIRTKIILLSCLICIFSILAATMISHKVLSENIKKQTFGKLEEVSGKYAIEIESWFEIQTRLVNELYDEITYKEDLNKNDLIKYFSYKNKKNKDNIEYYIALPENAFIRDTGIWYPPTNYNTVDRQWYIDATKTQEIALSPPYVDVNHGKIIVTISKAIRKDGETIAVLGSDISIDHIVNIISETKTSFEGYGFLIDDEGNILAHPNKDFLYSNKKGLTNITQIVKEGNKKTNYIDENGIRSIIDYDGIEKYLLYTNLGVTDWDIVLATPVDVVMAPLNKVVNQSIILGIILTIISVILTFILANSISKPITIATKYIEEMATLNISKDIDQDYLNMNNEIGRMFESFQMIVESLRGFLIDLSNLSNRISTFSDELAISSHKSNNYTNEISENLSNIKEGNHGKFKRVTNIILYIDNFINQNNRFIKDNNIINEELLEGQFKVIIEEMQELSIEFNKIKNIEEFETHQISAINELIEEQVLLMEEISSASQCLAELGEELNIYIGKFDR